MSAKLRLSVLFVNECKSSLWWVGKARFESGWSRWEVVSGGSGLPLLVVKEKERLRLLVRVARARSDRCVSARQKERWGRFAGGWELLAYGEGKLLEWDRVADWVCARQSRDRCWIAL